MINSELTVLVHKSFALHTLHQIMHHLKWKVKYEHRNLYFASLYGEVNLWNSSSWFDTQMSLSYVYWLQTKLIWLNKPSWAAIRWVTHLFVLCCSVLFCLSLPFLCSMSFSQPVWQLLSFLNCTHVKREFPQYSDAHTRLGNEIPERICSPQLFASAPRLCCQQPLGVSIRTGRYSCVRCVVTGSSMKAERYEPIKGFYEYEFSLQLGIFLVWQMIC